MAPSNSRLPRLKTKLLSFKDTGKLHAHHHTSYGGLLIIMMLALSLVSATQWVAAADPTDPMYASNSVQAVVPAPLPTTAPVITNLADGKVVTTNDSLLITGTCSSKSIIKVFKNEVLAGAGNCQKGSFSLSIDLFIGRNTLVARAYNADNIPGPDSAPVIVSLLPTSATASGVTASQSQFYLTSDAYYRGAGANQTLRWPLSIAGGQAPYSLLVSWGDGQTETINRGTSGQFIIDHRYTKAAADKGSYTIVVKATDQQGTTALLQLAAVIPGAVPAAATTGHGGLPKFQIAWQSLLTITALIISFWIGEKRELRLLQHHAVGLA